MKIFNEIISDVPFFIIGAYVGLIFTIVLIVLLFMKSSRDERGRAIIGKASIFSTIAFILLMNIVAKTLASIEINYVTIGNCIQWIYNIVTIIEVVAIMVLKKIS